ncbi:MAG: peroxiredoxin [Collimonas sp.]
MAQTPPALQQSVPDFDASMTSGRKFSLSAYRNKTLILYFYPKDGTPGCTTEGINFRDLYPDFQAANAEVIGVSRDSVLSHEAFKAKLDLPFELVSDPDETLCLMFAVMKSKVMYGKQIRGIERATFVIDGSGKLVKEWRELKVPGHVDEVLAYVQTLC